MENHIIFGSPHCPCHNARQGSMFNNFFIHTPAFETFYGGFSFPFPIFISELQSFIPNFF
jgi:hypothetical protein